MRKHLVSICILALNHLEVTKKCLVSLMRTDFPGNMEIILVDNGSTDGTSDWFREFQDRYSSQNISVVLILNKENRGCTGGRNQACKLAEGEFVVILDNDVEIIQADWLRKMMMFFEQSKDVGIVAPKMLFPDEPHKIQAIGTGITKNGRVGYLGQGKDRNDPEFSFVRELQGNGAACWLLKNKLFSECGYFDDIYYPVNFEDLDFCYRIREKGYKVLYYPDVEMYHHEHITTKNTPGLSRTRITVKNGLIFKERWRHMFENEDGIKEEEIYWEKMPY